MGALPEKLGAYAHRALTKLGVEVPLNTNIEQIDENGIVAGGWRIAARIVIWGARVKATPVAEWLGLRPGPHGTVSVNPDFSVPAHPNVFVVGDAAAAPGAGGKALPGLAAARERQARWLPQCTKTRSTLKSVRINNGLHE